ncbi:hypothetical protein FBU31_004571, partial [Coemansia sp. 'formosensis']
LEAKTIMVKGKPVQLNCIITHKDSLVYVNIAGISAMTMAILMKEICNALSFYGTGINIKFEQAAGCLVTSTHALIDANAAVIPRHVTIRGRKWMHLGKTFNLVCGYCKEVGHHLNNCEKKHQQEQPALVY